MPEMPTAGQIALLTASVLCIAASAGLSLARVWKDAERSRIAAKALLYWGMAHPRAHGLGLGRCLSLIRSAPGLCAASIGSCCRWWCCC